MPCLNVRDAIHRAETSARNLGLTMAIYCENNVFVVRILKQRTGRELEVVNP